jgi:hypothetical protein
MFVERGAVEPRGDNSAIERARVPSAAGLFFFVRCQASAWLRRNFQGGLMPNHLTPEELSKEMGIDRAEVIRVCLEEGVPIYNGKIDKTLFAAQLQALGMRPPEALAS